jgi:hypothetical protein
VTGFEIVNLCDVASSEMLSTIYDYTCNKESARAPIVGLHIKSRFVCEREDFSGNCERIFQVRMTKWQSDKIINYR